MLSDWAAEDLACAELLPASVSAKYERNDDDSYMAANLRWLAEGVSAGFLLGFGLSNQVPHPLLTAGIGGYMAADLLLQTGCELVHYAHCGKRLGACEQPGTILIEGAYKAGEYLGLWGEKGL